MHLTHKRIASAALVLIIAGALFAPAPPTANAQTSGEAAAIVETALQRDGTHGGQCWTFVQDVVQQATGRSMGFDYRHGFFDAGAIEVDPADAQAGDILQLSNPQDSSSYYSGMHTAIVLENLGGGVYLVVDSNYQWDEQVSVHEWTARDNPNLQLYAYRFGAGEGDGGGVVPAAREDERPPMLTDFVASAAADSASGELPTEESPAAPANEGESGGAPPEAPAGTFAIVGPGTCLNLRSGAGLGHDIVDCLPAGSGVTIIGDAVEADGHTWVQVETTGGLQGWVAADYLEVQEPEPEPVVAVSEPVAETHVLATAQAQVDADGSCLNLRTAAGTSADSIDCLPDGTSVTVIEAGIVADGIEWSQVTTAPGQSGWVASEYLTAVPGQALAASSGSTEGLTGASTFAAEVERWRTLVAAAFPAAVVDDVLSVIACQSSGNPDATGASGEQGLLQIHPTYHQGTAEELFGVGASLYDPEVNLGVAAQMSAGGTDWSPWACQP